MGRVTAKYEEMMTALSDCAGISESFMGLSKAARGYEPQKKTGTASCAPRWAATMMRHCPGDYKRSETIAIHGGYEIEPTTKAVAVPIYQTVAFAFDSAEHGAALFNLEVDGFRYTRINNPTTAVLERRVAALERGVEALGVSTGQAALHYAVLNVATMGKNIVSVPQLYGTTHTLFAHLLPS